MNARFYCAVILLFGVFYCRTLGYSSSHSADRDFYIFPFLLMSLFISAGAIYIPRHVRRTPELMGSEVVSRDPMK
jgi:uncharacterized membrane protein